MKKCTKVLAFLLLASMLLILFIACKGEKKPSEEVTDTETAETSAIEESNYDQNGYLKDSLPISHNFGKEFKIFTWTEQKAWEWIEEDVTGTPATVEKVLWEREINVEERFGVDLVRVYENGNWDNRTSFINSLSTSVLGNDHEYDLVGQYTPAGGIGAIAGLYMDLKQVPYLDLEKPWWPTSTTETASLGDKLFFVTGDITPTMIRNVQCMFVNTQLYDDYQLFNDANGKTIYEVVNDYEWTIEKLMTMALNKVSVEQGEYGITMLNNVAADAFFYGGGFTYVESHEGIIKLSDDLSSTILIDYFDKVQSLFVDRYEDSSIAGLDPFMQGKALFLTAVVSYSQLLSEDGVTFSVLPMPLRDETQQEYTTCTSFWVTVYSIPVDVANREMSCIILEALGSEAYRTVSDEIYYDLFKIRYNGTDENTARMFDLVSDSVVFDAARFFPDALKMYSLFRNGVVKTSGNWSTIYGGGFSTWNDRIKQLYLDIQ